MSWEATRKRRKTVAADLEQQVRATLAFAPSVVKWGDLTPSEGGGGDGIERRR